MFRVQSVLGTGGMGVVFLAEDEQLRRQVALKVMWPKLAEVPAHRQRFLREAQAAASLDHEHIVHIYQVGEANGTPFIAMQFLQGETLDARLYRTGRLPVSEAVRIAREIAEGLAAAHAKGLIHRDVKPGNVFLAGVCLAGERLGVSPPRSSQAGATDETRWVDAQPLADLQSVRVKLLDFGLVRVQDDRSQLTQDGTTLGTPSYMPPEQARGETVDARGDLYALGAVLYRMLTGHVPFTGKSTMAVLMALAEQQPASVRSRTPDVSETLDQIVLRLLAKNPAERFQSASEVIAALDHHQGERLGDSPPSSCAATTSTPLTDSAKRSRWANAQPLAIVATVILLAGLLIVETDKGTVRVETLDDDVQVVVEQNGKLVRVLDKQNNFELRVRSGTYSLRLETEKQNVKLESDSITILRGQTAVAKIVGAVPATTQPLDDWIAATQSLNGQKQVDTFAAKLSELNPGWDRLPPTAKSLPLRSSFWDNDPNHPASNIELTSNELSDVSPLRVFYKLVDLTLEAIPPDVIDDSRPVTSGRVRDLSPVAHLQQLTTLNVSFQPVRDLSPLQSCENLWSIGLNRTLVDDLSPLAKLSKLEQLYIANAAVGDLTPLSGSKLTHLQIVSTQVSDLKPLAGLKLKWLRCAYSPIMDLSPLAGQPIEYLECNACQITDLSPLRGMPLTHLRCEGNEGITDLTPLRDLPLAELHCDSRNLAGANLDALRAITTLKRINDQPAASLLAK